MISCQVSHFIESGAGDPVRIAFFDNPLDNQPTQFGRILGAASQLSSRRRRVPKFLRYARTAILMGALHRSLEVLWNYKM